MAKDKFHGRPPIRYRLLVLLPWGLVLMLLMSSFFPNSTLEFYFLGIYVHFKDFLRIICVSGLIGFLTNWVAITMLFRPSERRPLLGQGLIPAQKKVISEKLATAIQTNLINSTAIRDTLLKSDVMNKLLDAVEHRAASLSDDATFRESIYSTATASLRDLLKDDDLRDAYAEKVLSELNTAMPQGSVERVAFRTYLRFRENEAKAILNQTILQIPSILYENRHHFDDVIETLPLKIRENRAILEDYFREAAQKMADEVDIKAIVYENLNSYDEKRLETLIKESTMDQLNYIKYLGGVLGMLGGLVIWNPILALILVGGGISSYLLLDILLYRLK